MSAAPAPYRLSAGAAVALCAASALLAFAVAKFGPALLDRNGKTKFATVDLASVVRKRQESSVALLADASNDRRARDAALASAREFGERLDRELAEMSGECGCVLLMREAVVSGQLDDLTPALLSRLSIQR